jgi:hypothetical protein
MQANGTSKMKLEKPVISCSGGGGRSGAKENILLQPLERF